MKPDKSTIKEAIAPPNGQKVHVESASARLRTGLGHIYEPINSIELRRLTSGPNSGIGSPNGSSLCLLGCLWLPDSLKADLSAVGLVCSRRSSPSRYGGADTHHLHRSLPVHESFLSGYIHRPFSFCPLED